MKSCNLRGVSFQRRQPPVFLLNNVDLNPLATEEILITFRSKDSFLIKLIDMSIVRCYDSVDEVRYGKFSQCGKYVYTLTKTGTLNIFNKNTAKLISKLNPNMMMDTTTSSEQDAAVVDVEVDGILRAEVSS